MAEINTLLRRIDAEFHAIDDKIKKNQIENLQEYRERQKRLIRFGKLLDEVREIWNPRLEALRQRFGDQVHVTPRSTPSRSEATFEFRSTLAKLRLKFALFADRDMRYVQLTSDLEIVPSLIQCDAHAEMQCPLESTNLQVLADWFDDRIVSVVRTYLTLHQDNLDWKKHLVEDPVTRVWFPRYAAGATLEWKGSTYYFVDNESRLEFAKQNQIPVK
jgi:hypothetical protein